jgi:AraC-like DNA-binding protein
MLLFCFFGNVKQWNQWKGVTWLAGAIVALTMIPLVINAWLPGSILQPDKWGGQFYLWIAAAISILMMCYCAVAMWQVWIWMRQASNESYSNPDDFPNSYAHRVWLAPVFFTPFLWAGFITDSPNVMFWMNLVLSLMHILLLITVLPAWRRADIIPGQEEEYNATSDEDTYESCNIVDDRMNKIAKFIDEYVNQQQAFLNPHLKIENVVNGCGYSRTYVSKAFQEYYGGFFNYVNKLRLAYYNQYAADHPSITKEAIAQASGFTSYQSYYKVRERMKEMKETEPTS